MAGKFARAHPAGVGVNQRETGHGLRLSRTPPRAMRGIGGVAVPLGVAQIAATHLRGHIAQPRHFRGRDPAKTVREPVVRSVPPQANGRKLHTAAHQLGVLGNQVRILRHAVLRVTVPPDGGHGNAAKLRLFADLQLGYGRHGSSLEAQRRQNGALTPQKPRGGLFRKPRPPRRVSQFKQLSN